MNFALTKHWFNEVESGRKVVEFRAKKDYWTKRVDKLDTGSEITFFFWIF